MSSPPLVVARSRHALLGRALEAVALIVLAVLITRWLINVVTLYPGLDPVTAVCVEIGEDLERLGRRIRRRGSERLKEQQ